MPKQANRKSADKSDAKQIINNELHDGWLENEICRKFPDDLEVLPQNPPAPGNKISGAQLRVRIFDLFCRYSDRLEKKF